MSRRPEMSLAPVDDKARQTIVDNLFQVDELGVPNRKSAEYVAKTFPSILLDVARLLTEQATNTARVSSNDPATVIKNQLKPFLMFSSLLGKCPQITGLMYSYFENSNFQPFPEKLTQNGQTTEKTLYNYPGFDDGLVKAILLSYFKYLAFNPKWFSTIWNWSELGSFINHSDCDIRYIAGCCLAIITKPSRLQHLTMMREIVVNKEDKLDKLIELQVKHSYIFVNPFKPCIDTKQQQLAEQYARGFGFSDSGYSYCSESLTKVANILLIKRDIRLDKEPQVVKNRCEQTMKNYISVQALEDPISKIAYAVSTGKPCLIRGPSGYGKTSVIDYIAAHTNRSDPPDYLKVQIGDQIDSKLLIGSYVCTEIPGQFEWKPGPLTRALVYGSWIVFEDIDSAPADMAQVIHSVLENGNLSCVSSCPIKLERPHPEFRIFFTQRSQQNKISNSFRLGFGFVEKLCDIVDLPELTDEDLKDILEKRFGFNHLTKVVLQLFQTAYTSLVESSANRVSRAITLRDLFRYCERLTSRQIQQSEGKFSSSDLEFIYLEAIDCFLSSLPKKYLMQPASKLGVVLNLALNEVERLLIEREMNMREGDETFSVGRVRLRYPVAREESSLKFRSTLAYTRSSLQLLESICLCMQNRNPVLLVGETGVGKTSIVQHLANLLGVDLTVINLSQQSDSSDLLGGYKPVDIREIMKSIYDQFVKLFKGTWDVTSNAHFLSIVEDRFISAARPRDWITYLGLISQLCIKSLNINKIEQNGLKSWSELYDRVKRIIGRMKAQNDSNPMALKFSEGSLLKAVRDGKWILLDEINLAEPDVLQSLLLILDSVRNPQVHMHNLSADEKPIPIHPRFRIFACMNPSTDIGKRDLPIGTRGRFIEFYVDDVTERRDLRLIVESYVKSCINSPQIEKIVNFYLEIKARAHILSDISGNTPVYSLRTLCRALSICSNNVCKNIEKSLYESFKITFLQQLNDASIFQVMKLLEQHIFDKKTVVSLEEFKVSKPTEPNDIYQYLQVEGFWIRCSSEKCSTDERYIMTESIRKNLRSLSRIISLSQRRLPILIQGNTSVGKTSLIMYLARITGNKCYRINNHEHTDLQEYVGRYNLNQDGELEWYDGLLVRAMKKGYWLILDELNLAPCELLEALNRVLDENRELFIPEKGEVVRAHSNFILFATQNPPEEYAGRKLLSRAFRNRFIELHFDEIPSSELEVILEKRCEMAPKYAKKIVTVMRELQLFRRESGCFNGKSGFMTLRDLFRWGERYCIFKGEVPDNETFDWEGYLAGEGLILLEGKVRTLSEANIVKTTIERVFRQKLDRDTIYPGSHDTQKFPAEFKHIQFSDEFNRLYHQLTSALKYREPVLLCGQTGSGKTTACQLYASIKKQTLLTYNCHLNTESADFVGGIRPSRAKGEDCKPFAWCDGPLVEAMKRGSWFLMDEISLADDAVLERINSVLEPERSITLTELDGSIINANPGFRFIATMNPGGDYGKKELSIALRNRFTEIYCHNTTDINQIRKIIEACLSPPLLKPRFAPKVLHVMHNFLREFHRGTSLVSIRDVISWTQFLNKTVSTTQPRPLSLQEAIIHGASLVYLDQFGTCGHQSRIQQSNLEDQNKSRCFLKKLVEDKFDKAPEYLEDLSKINGSGLQHDMVQFKKFCLEKGPNPIFEETKRDFVLDVPIVKRNVLRLVRAMQLDRPILLEGNPGSGKTSIVSALAKLTGNKLVRINLSEQTDISDLFGSDLPDENMGDDEKPNFCWHDGPMLKAIQDSHWILLDEMNLASQSVLEGLNACLDHRGEIYIAELNKKITVNRSKSRIFACQNPHNQGASRKGLPQSFLNRFTSIHIESHSSKDLVMIVRNLYSAIPIHMVEKMVKFNNYVSSLCQLTGFEFNLRDLIYWCELITNYVNGSEITDSNMYKPDKFAQFVYLDRLRDIQQRQEVFEAFERIFGYPVYEPPYREIRLGERSFIMTRAILPRKSRLPPHLSDVCILKFQMPFIESVAKAIELKKMPILVGETGTGKRTIVRILAGMTGNELSIIGANEEMDTVELLGSFEQRSFERELVELIEDAKHHVTNLLNSTSQKHGGQTWSQLFRNIWLALYDTSKRDLKLSQREMLEAYQFQLSQMRELLERLEPLNIHNIGEKLQALRSRIDRLLRRFVGENHSVCSSGSFEWLDSVLVRAIKGGHWLMIENANLMNPATLDRLNSLVEPNGSLSLNEKGSGKNGIETLTPHPDFRLILTMSPDQGELSRAMRNRGVEIYVKTSFYFEDFLMLLNQNGFEPEERKACMTYCIMQTSYDTHKKITGESPEEGGALLAYFALNYTTALMNQVRRGVDVNLLLADLLISFYMQKGRSDETCRDEIVTFVGEKMTEYGKKYEVKLIDERYKWRHLVHDLFSMTGGDAITAMLDRDSRIFYDDPNIEAFLEPDEIVENIDIVNTCIQVKLFFELSTHGDFHHRRAVIRETFKNFDKMLAIVDKHVNLLKTEYIPLMKSLMPQSDVTPASDMQVDTRNSPDIHFYLLAQDYAGTIKREKLQNRWFLTLHRVMLQMIIDMVEDRSMNIPDARSLWTESEKVRINDMPRENLIRPCAEVASDLYDLLNGIMRVVSYRCFDDAMVAKMLPKFFWLSYFICKLKRSYPRDELIAVCNQIPMLWALTCQKVIGPLDEDCGLANLVYKNKKFSSRVRSICEALDVTLAKPGALEKIYHKRILNMYASTMKFCERISREVDKFFAVLIGRYTSRAHALALGDDNADTLAAAGYIWSNTTYMDSFYLLEDKLLDVENAGRSSWVSQTEEAAYVEANAILNERKEIYLQHEKRLSSNEQYKISCLNENKIRSALDQFAPIWQLDFLHLKLSKISSNIEQPMELSRLIQKMLKNIDGLMMSPRYYACLMKYLQRLEERKAAISSTPELTCTATDTTAREDLDMYFAFLADHLIEKTILDNQIVGWTKLRVTTSNLPARAPLIPEYSPVISLVGSYCLDVAHLKLNAYLDNDCQLKFLLRYLWKNYASIKTDSDKDVQDIDLAWNLLHLRLRVDNQEELIGSHICNGTRNCGCIEEYIRKKLSTFDETLKNIKDKSATEDVEQVTKAIKLISFGYLTYSEHAPIFTIDPSLKSREKLEIYKSELAHIKLDLNLRNTLFYWKTGENLQLNEIDQEEASIYPFSARMLVQRRVKLENSIKRLRREHTMRPKTDDGSVYMDLRKDVEIEMNRCNNYIQSLIGDLLSYLHSEGRSKSAKFNNLTSRSRVLIKNIERSISRFRLEYALFTDITLGFLVGLSFVHQGLRCLYSRLEQKLQIMELGFSGSVEDFTSYVKRFFSFNNFIQGDMESVDRKLEVFCNLEKVCPQETVSHIQSVLLKTVLIQLCHHIMITPSDIEKCIPIVHRIADLFYAAWLKRKLYLEDLRKKKEELYQYKPTRTTLGTEITYEQQEFLELCSKFPTYDHIFKDDVSAEPLEAEKENLCTEEKVITLSRSVDLSVCIDICKAHYNFTKEASRNLLGQVDFSKPRQPPKVDLSQLVKLEAQALYTIIRNCVTNFDYTFDSQSIECHLLQASELIKSLQPKNIEESEMKSLKGSIEILDEQTFDVYHDAYPHEALKLQSFIYNLTCRVSQLRLNESRSYASHSTLSGMTKLTTKISSFLMTDPLMKFVTGAHTLLAKLEEWNSQSIPKADKLLDETDVLIELIKHWRKIEVVSWRNSLHRVKRQYIDSTLCDLWFQLYEAFNNPIVCIRQFYRRRSCDEESIASFPDEVLYQLFALYIKEFFEEATLGDYQIRLDLVFSFAIQARFLSLHPQAQPNYHRDTLSEEKEIRIDFGKLTTYVYNLYRQYQGLLEPLKENLESEEDELSKELKTEIRIVSWHGRSLWDMKNNFRISHKKLNKVINKYLEILRQHVVFEQPGLSILEIIKNHNHTEESEWEKMSATLAGIQLLVGQVKAPNYEPKTNIEALSRSFIIVNKLKELYNTVYSSMSSKYIDNLSFFEQAIHNNQDAIENFFSHDVSQIVIRSRDSAETKAEKLKSCRQMHHSKKFALQSIFKELQNLGASYQRGLNSGGELDLAILSSEPLRGMIQNQSFLVLEAACRLVDESIIRSCNAEFRKLIPASQYLLQQPYHEQLSTDQMERIRGFAFDIVFDVTRHYRGAAYIYRYMMDIQAATTRLNQLQGKFNQESVVIFNFSRVHKATNYFNDLVGRAYLAITKLKNLAECHETAFKTLVQENSSESPKVILDELIDSIKDKNSLMTIEQLEHLSRNLNTRERIAEISYELRDRLNYTTTNHIYSKDDLEKLMSLYNRFITAFDQLTHNIELTDDEKPKDVSILRSLRSLSDEARLKLKPDIEAAFKSNDVDKALDIKDHPNLRKLNVRLKKLVRSIKIAAQNIHNLETCTEKSKMSLKSKRETKPFNFVNSEEICKSLQTKQVFKHIEKCFLTLNNEEQCFNIDPIITNLAPVLFIYTQDVACYLNIILSTLRSKIASANLLIPFFINLVQNGFGLPYQVPDDTPEGDQMKSKSSDDNAGFGEGQGEMDVSEKLELESQLDDLKNSESAEKKEEAADHSVEAHDNGVEMSDDIDAKAEGSNGQETNEDDNQEKENDDINELDKELDKVDEDEGQLDEKLWGKDEEVIEEDDEEDLRETTAESVAKQENQERSMQAQDEAIGSSKVDEERADNKTPESHDQSEDANGKNDEKPSEAEFDLTDEAAQALKESEACGGSNDTDERQKEDEIEMVDLSSDTEPEQHDKKENPCDGDVDVQKDELDVEKDEVDVEKDDVDVEKDDVDVEKESVQPEDTDAEMNSNPRSSQNVIDDAEIDDQLEGAISEPSIEEELPNPFEETIRSFSAQAQGKSPDSKGEEIKGKKVGGHTLYDIFEEEDDSFDIDEQQELNNQAIEYDGENQRQSSDNEKQSTSVRKSNSDGEPDREINKNENEQEELEQKSTKRTIVEQRGDSTKELKRQKINEAKNDENIEPPNESQSKNKEVRHIDHTKNNSEIEMIDLVSDDEETLTDKNQVDSNLESSSKPKESQEKYFDLGKPESQSFEPLISQDDEDEFMEANDGETLEEKIEDAKSEEKADICGSPISSIDEGELLVESDEESKDGYLNTTYNTNLGLLKYISLQEEGDGANQGTKYSDLMEQIDQELVKKPETEHNSLNVDRLASLWRECTKSTEHLVQELCQQLQIVLQPTKMSKYKGDYKSGKRLNMRKIISYIASHYRKDKIWLRRTKPSKRTYHITIAVDNSSSMSENNCRQMTYQSLALLAKSLSLIEAGSLSVVSFGEQVRCVHEFGQPFMEAVGAQWLRELRFNEKRTSYKQLLSHACESFAKQAQVSQVSAASQACSVSQLLIIISDGRNVSSEEQEVKNYLRQLKTMRVLTLFVIIDDLKRNDGKSIVDVKRIAGIGLNIQTLNYMELFPFPFYVLLRRLETMPSVLGDALRQWFELVSNS